MPFEADQRAARHTAVPARPRAYSGQVQRTSQDANGADHAGAEESGRNGPAQAAEFIRESSLAGQRRGSDTSRKHGRKWRRTEDLGHQNPHWERLPGLLQQIPRAAGQLRRRARLTRIEGVHVAAVEARQS